MLLTEVDNMSWFAHGLLQVPYHEILTLINRKELAQACCKLHICKLMISRRCTLGLLIRGLIRRSLSRSIILEV